MRISYWSSDVCSADLQVINVRDNERISFEYGLAQARGHGNAKAVAELESIAPYPGDQPITRERIIIARKWPQFYGGMTAYRDGSAKYFFGAPLLSHEYDAADVQAIDAGHVFPLGRLLPALLQVAYPPVRHFPKPAAMLQGPHASHTTTQPTPERLRTVDAQ